MNPPEKTPLPRRAPVSERARRRLPRGMDALGAQIAEVEQRLVTREQALLDGWNACRQDLRTALRPGRTLLPLAALALSALPLLPRRWRAALNPAALATLLSIGAPLMKQLQARRTASPPRPRRPAPVTAPFVDLPQYMGRWYEVARLPNRYEAPCAGQPTAFYAATDTGQVTVINRCPTADGRVREARGVARVVPGGGGARLKLSFLPRALRWLPGAWADYWILHVDIGYTEALVGDPQRRCLWVLSRIPSLAPERLEALLARARAQGYDLSRLRRSGDAETR